MKLTLKVWRQKNSQSEGKFVEYQLDNVSEGSSFLEMLDILSEQQVAKGEEPIAFDHDCREGICGMCSMTINGVPHGPQRGTTAYNPNAPAHRQRRTRNRQWHVLGSGLRTAGRAICDAVKPH